LDSKIFEECLEAQKNSHGKPFWDTLAKKYSFKNGEKLRDAVKNEKRKMGYFNPNSDNYQGTEAEEENSTYEQGDDFINVVCASKRVLSKEDIIKQFNIDLDIWEIEKFKVKTSEGYRKDRQVSWHVQDGKVNQGDVEDTGKMLIVPLYHVEVRLIKKKKEVIAKDAITSMIEDAKSFSPYYPKINYTKYKEGCLYELDMFDIHFGRLAWEEETGESSDIKLARLVVNSTINKLLSYAKNEKVSKILFPVGNDFFNVDSKFNTTTAGTPQQEDTRWQKTFRNGRKLMVDMIDMCSTIAPVDVLVIPGNHDEQRSFYLGEALECWYNNNKNVNIDNSAMKRKYYKYGSNLIGFTHGSDEKLDKLPLIMAMEQPQLWAQTQYREWHTGDKHHLRDMMYTTVNEGGGMVVRILRSLASADAWTFNKGFVGALRASQSFLWHPEDGLIAQFTATPDAID
jgi:hypothetical protein